MGGSDSSEARQTTPNCFAVDSWMSTLIQGLLDGKRQAGDVSTEVSDGRVFVTMKEYPFWRQKTYANPFFFETRPSYSEVC